jgi:1-acyl-sn-glycerol-3-phosphate acyltransferase
MPMTLSSYPNEHLKRLRFNDDVRQLTWFYRISQVIVTTLITLIWRVRTLNRRFEPDEGGVLYVSNHQSFLDPILVAFALQRPMNFMARHSLFKNTHFAKFIESFNAFPVKRGTGDVGALKEAMRRLKDGKQLVVFPEGTRTQDGRIGKFLPGITMLAQRAAKWTIPVVIDGAEIVWPRSKMLPTIGNIIVQYGEPISQEEARQYDAQSFANMVRRRLTDIQHDVRQRMGKNTFDYDTTPNT